MKILTNLKYYEKLKSQKTTVKDIKVTLKEDIEVPILTGENGDGETVNFLVGYEPIISFLKNGFNRIIKKCPLTPFRFFKCKGKKCQWYFVDGITGDCSMIWRLFRK